jgi:hypothetical protein
MPRGEYWKLVNAFNAYELRRKGYWACVECGAHNPNHWRFCIVCTKKSWKEKMPTTLLSAGVPTAIIQNQIYALPPVRCLLYCDTAAATFEQSNTVTMTLATALTPDANEQIEVAGGFLRCTSGNVIVTLKRA